MKIRFIAVMLFLSVTALCQVEKNVAPGVKLYQKITNQPPLIITWIKTELKNSNRVKVQLSQDKVINNDAVKGRETVSSIAKRHNAAVALNGDFFPWTGDPLGICVQNGELISEPSRFRSAVGFNQQGDIIFGQPVWMGVIQTDKEFRTLDGINRTCGANESVLITPIYGNYSNNGVFDAVVFTALDKEVKIGANVKGLAPKLLLNIKEITPPKNGAALIMKGTASTWIQSQLNDKKGFIFKMLVDDSEKWDKCSEVIGGGPWLVKNGKSLVDDTEQGFNNDFSKKRHPRSAIGKDKDGNLILAVVDGRQPASRGATLEELSAIMLELGAVQAINLDGGGSTSLTLWGNIINSQSEDVERPIANAVLVLLDKPSYESVDELSISPGNLALPIGSKQQLVVVNSKTNTPIDSKDIAWSSNNRTVFVNQQGEIVAIKKGISVITAMIKGCCIRSVIIVGDETAQNNQSVNNIDSQEDKEKLPDDDNKEEQ